MITLILANWLQGNKCNSLEKDKQGKKTTPKDWEGGKWKERLQKGMGDKNTVQLFCRLEMIDRWWYSRSSRSCEWNEEKIVEIWEEGEAVFKRWFWTYLYRWDYLTSVDITFLTPPSKTEVNNVKTLYMIIYLPPQPSHPLAINLSWVSRYRLSPHFFSPLSAIIALKF